jgi:hypothetical protein
MTTQDIADGADTMILLNAEVEKRILLALQAVLPTLLFTPLHTSAVTPKTADDELDQLRASTAAALRTCVEKIVQMYASTYTHQLYGSSVYQTGYSPPSYTTATQIATQQQLAAQHQQMIQAHLASQYRQTAKYQPPQSIMERIEVAGVGAIRIAEEGA